MRYKRQRGTQDVLPERAVQWRWVTERMRSVCRAYGYGEIRTPLFEETALFERGVGADTDIVQKEMYTFVDRKGRSLSLRPEGTASVVRAFVESNLGREGGVHRFHYLGPMYRYDRPQAGRYREFFQVGAEAIGSARPEQDAEVIDLMMEMFRTLGLTSLHVEINSVGGPESRAAYEGELRLALDAERSALCETCCGRIAANPLRVFDCKNEACRAVLARLPKLGNHLSAADRAHHASVLAVLDGLEIPWRENDMLVRGLDYYTRTTFEVHYPPLGAQSALGGGGRYDALVEACGGPPTPAVGFSAGIERVLYALEQLQPELLQLPCEPAVVLLPLGERAMLTVLRLARDLRRVAPVGVELTGRSLKAQLRSVGRGTTRVAVIVGDAELERGEALVRDLQRGTQTTHAFAALAGAVHALLELQEAGGT